jgi:hypothetical protein
MTDKKPRSTTSPLAVANAATRIAAAIAELPDEAAIAERIRAEATAQRKALQDRISALVARVPEGEREKLGRLVLALTDPGGLCGFSLGVASNDADAAANEVPERLRSPVPPPKPGERVEVVRK